jgi:hypothetical protein
MLSTGSVIIVPTKVVMMLSVDHSVNSCSVQLNFRRVYRYVIEVWAAGRTETKHLWLNTDLSAPIEKTKF